MGRTKGKQGSSKQRKQRGYVLVTVGFAMVALIGFAALAIDVGFLYSKRTNYQRAADAAALAGAFTFVVEPKSAQPGTATAHAIEMATTNTAMGTPITPDQVSVTFPPDPVVGAHLVQVTINATSQTFFGSLFVPAVNITVTATAEAATATGATCVKPWFIPNTLLSSLPPATGAGLDPCVACQNQDPGSSMLLAVQGATGNLSITDFAQSKLGAQLSITPSNPSQTLTPGQFFGVDFVGSAGANDYRDNVAHCSSVLLSCQNSYGVRTGAVIGPTSQGVQQLIGNQPDQYQSVGQYLLFSGQTTDISHQLVLAPIWDTCNTKGTVGSTPTFCPTENFPSGTTPQVNIVGFALLFIEGMQGNAVQGRLINVMVCGQTNIQGQAPFAVPVRLVHQ